MMRIEGVKRVDKDDRPFTPAKAILEEIKQDTLRSSNCGDCVIDDWDWLKSKFACIKAIQKYT